MRSFVPALIPLFLFACSSSTAKDPSETPDGVEEARSSLARDTAPVVADAAKQQLTSDINQFAVALFKQSAKPTENLVQSPHSIATALAMAFAGAAGQTKTDLATALHFTLPDAELHAGFNWLDLDLEARAKGAMGKDGKPARVHVDNLLFGAHTAELGAPFLDTLAVNYGAGVQRVDFAEKETVTTINDWVAARTENRIPELVSELPSSTQLVLVNTVYVNSAWAQKFEKNATRDDAFHAPSGDRKVPFMHRTGWMGYAESDAAQLVQIPLQTAGLMLEVILPKTDLASFESGLTADSLAALTANLPGSEVALSLPKFKLEPTADGSIKPQLSALGMGSAFEGAADFSPMVTNEKVRLLDVVHKTFFEIDEEGLEAAAATAVLGGGSASPPPPPPVPVVLDRPFLVSLRNSVTGEILFLGHIVDPSTK